MPRLATRYGSQTALITAARELSFAELDRESSNLAAGMRARGVDAGDIDSLFSANRREWIVAYHATPSSARWSIPSM